MSYCRFSSDDFKCDVYCYEDFTGGYTTWVASFRHDIKDSDLPPKLVCEHKSEEWWDKIFERNRVISKLLKDSKRIPIKLKYDGHRFNDPTPGKAAERLIMLRDTGYNVPQYAIDALLEEEKENQK